MSPNRTSSGAAYAAIAATLALVLAGRAAHADEQDLRLAPPSLERWTDAGSGGGYGPSRPNLVSFDLYSFASALLSGFAAEPAGLLLSVALRFERATGATTSRYLQPSVAYTNWNGLNLLAVGLHAGMRWWPLQALEKVFVGARAGASAQVIGSFGLDLHVLAEAGYALQLGPLSLALGLGAGIMIPVISAYGSDRVGSDASTRSPSLMFGLMVYPGIRF